VKEFNNEHEIAFTRWCFAQTCSAKFILTLLASAEMQSNQKGKNVRP